MIARRTVARLRRNSRPWSFYPPPVQPVLSPPNIIVSSCTAFFPFTATARFSSLPKHCLVLQPSFPSQQLPVSSLPNSVLSVFAVFFAFTSHNILHYCSCRCCCPPPSSDGHCGAQVLSVARLIRFPCFCLQLSMAFVPWLLCETLWFTIEYGCSSFAALGVYGFFVFMGFFLLFFSRFLGLLSLGSHLPVQHFFFFW